MVIWSEKYRPSRVEEMVGNEQARLLIVKWLSGWVSGSKPLLLVGPPGVGKTTIVRVLAAQMGYDLVEMNASDTRNKEILQARISPVLANTGIFGKKILLFIDEVDGISGREDTGGLDTLIDLMQEPTVPVIMAANTKSSKIKDLGKACRVVEFGPVPDSHLAILLNHVLAEQKVSLPLEDRAAIVRTSRGDARSMLNSAQALASGYSLLSARDYHLDIADAINAYFGSDLAEQAREYFFRADAAYNDPRFGASPEDRRKDMINALFSSIVSTRLKPDDLAVLLDILSKADVLVGRASKNMQWVLVRYAREILAYRMFEPSRRRGIKYSQYSMPWPLMGPIFARARSMSGLLTELSSMAHTSKSTFGSTVMPYMVRIIAESNAPADKIAEELGLDEPASQALFKEIERTKGIGTVTGGSEGRRKSSAVGDSRGGGRRGSKG